MEQLRLVNVLLNGTCPLRVWLPLCIFLALPMRAVFLFNDGIALNPDEQTMWQIATHHLEGNGYTFDGKENGYHSSFCVFMYEGLQRAGVSLDVWQLVSAIISLVLFIVSVFFFNKLLRYFISEKLAFWGTLFYLFYPSVIYYIGSMNFYENSVMPLMVIVVTVLATNLKTVKRISVRQAVFILLAAVISSYLRPSTLFIYCFLFAVCSFMGFKRAYIFPAMLSALLLMQAPAFIKHKQQFGSYTLSAQAGFELLQGHNEHARGSHLRVPFMKEDGLYQYARQHIAGIDGMNQFEESRARASLALDWIKKNPGAELKLALRKLVIYFLPQNYKVLNTAHWHNPMNLFVHLGFLAFLIIMFIRSPQRMDVLLIAIPVACLILTLIFFVVYRVRYFAEPFMIVCTMSMLQNLTGKSD